MKKQACEKLARALLPHLPGYTYEKKPNAIFQVPVGNVFRGMIFDSSGFSAAAFYPKIFSQALYVPSDHFTLTFGKCLLRNWEYEPGQEELLARRLLESMEREGAFKLLEDLSSADKMAVNLIKYHSNPNDPYLQQAIAFSFAVCGEFNEALCWLDKCRATLQEMLRTQPIILWPANLLDQVTKFRDLVTANPDAAKIQLTEWTEYTRSSLGLPA